MRHPAAKAAAKAAGQAPAKQEVSKKRSCSSASFTQRGESATLRKGALALAPLRNASTSLFLPRQKSKLHTPARALKYPKLEASNTSEPISFGHGGDPSRSRGSSWCWPSASLPARRLRISKGTIPKDIVCAEIGNQARAARNAEEWRSSSIAAAQA